MYRAKYVQKSEALLCPFQDATLQETMFLTVLKLLGTLSLGIFMEALLCRHD